METQAIVSHEPKDGQVVWRMEKVELNQTKDDELLVEIVATGICHTDIFFSSLDKGRIGIYPRVLGHEGTYSIHVQKSICLLRARMKELSHQGNQFTKVVISIIRSS